MLDVIYLAFTALLFALVGLIPAGIAALRPRPLPTPEEEPK